MKRVYLLVAVFITSLLCVSSGAWAGEGSTFDGVENIIVRAFTTNTVCSDNPCMTCVYDSDCTTPNTCIASNGSYGACVEVRDTTGVLLSASDFTVTDLSSGLPTPVTVTQNPFLIHSNQITTQALTLPDVSMSFDSDSGLIYLFCTNQGVHVMKYQIKNKANGACGSANGQTLSSAPSGDALCDNGTASAVTATATGWQWSCSGTTIGSNIGKDATCTATASIINGACGTSLNTCTAGTLQDVTDSSTNYLWNCLGISGGTPDYCSLAKPVDGACGSDNNGTFTTLLSSDSNLCSAGTVSGFATTSTGWSWSCLGLNGGSPANNCVAQKSSSNGADLVPTYFLSNSAGSNQLAFPAIGTVANKGTGSAGQFTVKVYMGLTCNTTGAQLLANGTLTIPGLAPGQSVNVSFPKLVFNGLALHVYYKIILSVDADNTVSETNEGNNIYCRDFEVL